MYAHTPSVVTQTHVHPGSMCALYYMYFPDTIDMAKRGPGNNINGTGDP